MPVVSWDAQNIQQLRSEGYREVGTTTIANQPARIFEQRLTKGDGTTHSRRLLVGINPDGITLGERISEIDANGVATTVFEVSMLLLEILPSSAAPEALHTWSPPTDAQVVDLAAPQRVASRFPGLSLDELERSAPFRVLRATSPWTVRNVFYMRSARNGSSANDRGFLSDAVLNGDAASVIYEQADSTRTVDLLFGPRDALVRRLQRTPAGWETARAVPAEVAGQQAVVWLATSNSLREPVEQQGGPPVAGMTLTALADLGDLFIVAKFQSFDEASALEFLRRLSSTPRP